MTPKAVFLSVIRGKEGNKKVSQSRKGEYLEMLKRSVK